MNGIWKWKNGISLVPYYQGYANMFCFSIKRANLKSETDTLTSALLQKELERISHLAQNL
jgi:hypothetical protein